MKKIAIFSVFLLILSFSVLIFPNSTYAKIDNYTISITCDVQGALSDSYTFSANKFTADYSIFADNGSITFTASAVSNLENPEDDQIEYQWLNSDKKVISESENLILYKSISALNLDGQIIQTDYRTTQSNYQSVYVLVVLNKTKNQKDEILVSVSISDENKLLEMQSLSSNIPATVYNQSEDISFYAIVPTLANNEVNWFIKYPNSTSFELMASGNKCVFSPSALINPKIGYGEFKVIAICKTSSKTFYSKTYTINSQPSAFVYDGPGSIAILNTKIENSKAKIEAFVYSLSKTTNMDYSNIYWYINGESVAVGDSFVYEPTSTDKYKVSVKYKDPNTGVLSEILDSHDEAPQTTDTHILILAILACVAVLSGILAISIVVTNKKRDVVW